MRAWVLAGVLMAAGSGIARAEDTVAQYADNAILNAAEHGARRVTLVFGDAPQADIDREADALRGRGYVLDEEAAILNPRAIRILRLGAHDEGGSDGERRVLLSVRTEP